MVQKEAARSGVVSIPSVAVRRSRSRISIELV